MLNLTAAGLNPTEAHVYEALLTREAWQPSDLAKTVGESRTNMYKVLDKLVGLGLAKKFDHNKKIHYQAANPSALLTLARKARGEREKAESELELHVQSLMHEYVKVHEQPGVQFFQGEKGLKEIYLDQIRTGEPIYIIRPDFNIDRYDFAFLADIKEQARKAGIQRYALTPDRPGAPKNHAESDTHMLLERTWLPSGEYTAPVEWNAYGNKIAVMSFGDEATGIIIDSPQISESLRQLYRLLEKGVRAMPGYEKLPKHARFIGASSGNDENHVTNKNH
jgi:sugar-specific transcriptional regulator TrmB